MASVEPAGTPVPGQRRRAADEPRAPEDPGHDPPYLDLDRLEDQARATLPPAVFDYYAGGAATETTLLEASAAWRSWRLRPRVLRGVAVPDLSTTVLGSAVATPIGVAPWAYQAMAHADGESATVRGAAAAGALFCASTSASTSLEDIAAVEPSAPTWFQLYRLHSPAHTDDLARRAGAAGYRALVLTVDLPVLGRRRRDARHGFALPADLPLANHPPEGTPGADSPLWTFDDIARFGELSGLPVVVKGVLRADDAVRCVQAGAAAVWVSAHGGRQADPVVPSAHALPEVVAAVSDEVEVYVDGGIRAGSDVLSALALGATAVFLGRPVIWGLAVGGAAGVARVLGGLAEELADTMVLCGIDGVRSVPRDTVIPAR